MIRIKQEVIDGMIRHASEDKSVEACGFLASSKDIIIDWYKLSNTSGSNKRFSVKPMHHFRVLKKIQGDGLKVSALYHSHPSGAEYLSEEDIAMADTDISHFLISLPEGRVRSFKIIDGKITEETIEVLNAV